MEPGEKFGLMKVASKLDDPDSKGAEPVVIKHAVFDELILANWSAKTLGEE